MNTIPSLIYPKHFNLDNPSSANIIIKLIKNFDDYNMVIRRCIGYENDIILNIIVNSTNFESYKTKINKDKDFIINFALKSKNISIVCSIFQLYNIPYFDEYDSLINQSKLVFEYSLINILEDFHYFLDNFYNLTNKDLLDKNDCLIITENYFNRPLTNDEKKELFTRIEETEQTIKELYEEINNMHEYTYNKWCEWLTESNYHSDFNSYPVEDQLLAWDSFINSFHSNH